MWHNENIKHKPNSETNDVRYEIRMNIWTVYPDKKGGHSISICLWEESVILDKSQTRSVKKVVVKGERGSNTVRKTTT